MSTQTPNLGLVKQAGGERPLVSDLNGNMDKLDAAVGAVDAAQDGSLQEQVAAIGTSLAQSLMPSDTQIAADVDLDDIKTPGVYVVTGNSSPSATHRPTDGWGVLIVVKPYKSNYTNTTQIWVSTSMFKARWVYGSGTWGSWN